VEDKKKYIPDILTKLGLTDSPKEPAKKDKKYRIIVINGKIRAVCD
jgi:hypothetical protein